MEDMPGMKLIAVAVPGRVIPGHSGDEVVSRLGGYDAVARAQREEETLALNLSINPERGYIIASKNAEGKPCMILARVRRWSDGRRTTEILGATVSLFTFNKPADFIYISHNPVVTGLELGKNSDCYGILPPYFTKVSFIPNLFKEAMSTTSRTEKRDKSEESQSLNAMVQFDNLGVPSAPLSSSLGTTPDSSLMSALEVLFNKRPVWLRASLDEHLPSKFTNWRKRIAFSRTCYLFSDGPWRGCMCKLGYDPRCDPSSRIYQIIDYRDPYYRTISWKTEKQSNGKSGQESESASLGIDKTYLKTVEQLVNFNPEVHFLVPPSRQSQLYQLCDIFDAGIQKLINDNLEYAKSGGPSGCSKTTGWYSQAILSKIRDMMNVKSLRMRQNMNNSNLFGTQS